MNKTKISSILKIVISSLIVLLIIVASPVYVKQNIQKEYEQEIQLTQLQANSHRQMMGYIIKTSENKVIVIDGGTSEDAPNLEKHIIELGNKVDVWFITHPHSDHAGAVKKIIEETEIQIDKIYYTMNNLEWYQQYAPERAYEAEDFKTAIQNKRVKDIVEEVTLNQIINIDFIKCEILGIKNPEITNDAINNSSMIIKMNLPESSILFLADTGIESGDKLLNTQKEKIKSDIVQVAHHGQNGAKESVYQAIQPSICLWPTPEWIWNNDNGDGENTGPWTTSETKSWMEKLEVKQNIIEKDGDITITVK